LVLNKIIEERQYFPSNMFAYQDNTSSIDVINYLKTKVSKSNLTFMIKADLKNFFPSIKKKYLMKGLAELVDIKDNKFYHLIKSYFRCGYRINVLSKSKYIGARKIKTIYKNTSKDLVYLGTVLAPLFSNILNSLIIKQINLKIEHFFMLGKNRNTYTLVNIAVNKKFIGTINNVEYKEFLQNIKPSCFINNYRRAWFVNYGDVILILGYLSKKIVIFSEILLNMYIIV